MNGYLFGKRMVDLTLAIGAMVILAPAILVLGTAIRFTSPGPAIYWSSRVGKENRLFLMPKFRTMRLGAPEMATHLLPQPDTFVTSIGAFLRNSSLDELPQLWSIFKGDMSFVGPRPALFNQDDLIALRSVHQVQQLVPGLTGWAQINGRDEIPIADKVALDAEYLAKRSLWFDFVILVRTAFMVVRREGISH